MPAKCGVSGTLYTYPNNPRADLIKISAEYGSSNVTVASHTVSEFTEKFPFSRVPAFETDEGILYDTMAIASLVGNSELRGCSEFERAEIIQWMNIAELELYPSACQILYPCWGLMPNNKGAINKAKDNLSKFMTNLNKFLESRTYLVGETVTLADLTLALDFRDLFSMVLEEKERATHGNVTRWFNTIINQDEVTRVVGGTTLCTKSAQFNAKLFAQNNPKQKKEPAPKKEQQPKKDEPKKEAPKDEKPAAKKPFADLSKPKLDMDTFKRLYWNEETPVIMKYFDENFVQGEYSVYKCVYKFSDELEQEFMTNNLVKGLMQRLESMRKFAFGLVSVFGVPEKKSFAVSGVWLGRGGGNFFEEDESWGVDIDCYNLTKLDMSKPDDKKFFSDFVGGTIDEFEGKPFLKDHIF